MQCCNLLIILSVCGHRERHAFLVLIPHVPQVCCIAPYRSEIIGVGPWGSATAAAADLIRTGGRPQPPKMTPNYWLLHDGRRLRRGRQSRASSRSRSVLLSASRLRAPLNNYEAPNYFSMSGTRGARGHPLSAPPPCNIALQLLLLFLQTSPSFLGQCTQYRVTE